METQTQITDKAQQKKSLLSRVMKLAWANFKRLRVSFSQALQLAWFEVKKEISQHKKEQELMQDNSKNSIEKLTDFLNDFYKAKFWAKGDVKRIYLTGTGFNNYHYEAAIYISFDEVGTEKVNIFVTKGYNNAKRPERVAETKQDIIEKIKLFKSKYNVISFS